MFTLPEVDNFKILVFLICNTSAEKLNLTRIWGISSAGLERYLDRVEVTGSNPVYPTSISKAFRRYLEAFVLVSKSLFFP